MIDKRGQTRQEAIMTFWKSECTSLKPSLISGLFSLPIKHFFKLSIHL